MPEVIQKCGGRHVDLRRLSAALFVLLYGNYQRDQLVVWLETVAPQQRTMSETRRADDRGFDCCDNSTDQAEVQSFNETGKCKELDVVVLYWQSKCHHQRRHDVDELPDGLEEHTL